MHQHSIESIDVSAFIRFVKCWQFAGGVTSPRDVAMTEMTSGAGAAMDTTSREVSVVIM